MGLLPDLRVGHTLGVITQWGSHVRMLQKLRDWCPYIMAVINTNDAVTQCFVHDELEGTTTAEFWAELSDLLVLIKPIDDTLRTS